MLKGKSSTQPSSLSNNDDMKTRPRDKYSRIFVFDIIKYGNISRIL